MTLALVEPTRTEWNLPKGHFSPSQCWLMSTCPECYRLEHIEGFSAPPSENLAVGSAVHAAIERQREFLLDGVYAKRAEHLRMAEFMEAASASFDADVKQAAETEPNELWPPDSITDLRPYKDLALKMARFAVMKLAPIDSAVKILAIEQRMVGLGQPKDKQEAELMAELGQEPLLPFCFEAYTDLVAEGADERVFLADLKTSADKRKPEWWPRAQLTMYSMGYWRAGIDVGLRIDQCVKQETPSFYQHWLEPPSDEWRQRVLEWIVGLAEDVSAGRFRMRPSWACNFSHGAPGLTVAVDGFA